MRPAGLQTDERAPRATGNPKNCDKESRRSPFAHHRCTFAFAMCFSATDLLKWFFIIISTLGVANILFAVTRSMTGFISRGGQIMELHTIT